MRSSRSSFAAGLRCPDDGHLLQPSQDSPVPYAMCRHCDGLWFSRFAIEMPGAKLPRKQPRPRKDASAETKRPCPQCSVALAPENVDGVVIDVCPKCGGVWLDPGEYRAARKHSGKIVRERRVPSLRQQKASKLGRFLDRVVDFVGDHFIEPRMPREPSDKAPPLGRGRRKP